MAADGVEPQQEWDVLPLPADAESTSLPVIHSHARCRQLDPVKVTLVSHGRARTNLRTLEVTTAVLGLMIIVTGLLTSFAQGSDPTAPIVIGIPHFMVNAEG